MHFKKRFVYIFHCGKLKFENWNRYLYAFHALFYIPWKIQNVLSDFIVDPKFLGLCSLAQNTFLMSSRLITASFVLCWKLTVIITHKEIHIMMITVSKITRSINTTVFANYLPCMPLWSMIFNYLVVVMVVIVW